MNEILGKNNYKIMIFSWNTESVSLGDTLDKEAYDINNNKYSEILNNWKYKCNIPDFYKELSDIIKDNDPDILVVGFQEDRFPGSYFHSHLLPNELPKLNYQLLKRNKLMGVGITTYKGILNCDTFVRGLRLSIYIKKNILNINLIETKNERYICSSLLTRSKGGVILSINIELMHNKHIRIGFICAHLPFNSKSIIDERLYNNKMLRQNELNITNTCFNKIIENLVLDNNINYDYIIYFGDLNYRISEHRPADIIANELLSNELLYIKELYENFDELKCQMDKQNIYTFNEGIENKGPIFLPTCKMLKNRHFTKLNNTKLNNTKLNNTKLNNTNLNNISWKLGKYNHRIPSWCDRILYKKYTDNNDNIKCIYYNRFDFGATMSKSDHAAVISIFDLSTI
jgi:hypothetical protein